MRIPRNKVALVPVPVEEVTKSGIILANTAHHRANEWERYSTKARVVGVPERVWLEFIPVSRLRPGDIDRGISGGQQYADVEIPNALRIGDLVTTKYSIWRALSNDGDAHEINGETVYFADYSQVLFRHGENGPEAIGPTLIGLEIVEEARFTKSGLVESVNLGVRHGICLVHSVGYDPFGMFGEIEPGMTVIHTYDKNFDMDYGPGKWQCVMLEHVLAAIPEGYTVEEAYALLERKKEFENMLTSGI